MRRFKNIRYFFLLFCACWSMVCGMEEGRQVVELTSRVEKLNISENQEPDQSTYFYKIDVTLYRKLFQKNITLPERSENLSELVKLIEEEEVTIDQKRTAFVCALKYIDKQENIVNAFLQTDFDLNFYFFHKGKKEKDDPESDECYLTPLTHAAKNGWMKYLKEFVKSGADVNFATPYKDGEYSNMTPLLWAANMGNKKIVKYLGIECGANPNIAQSKYAGKDAGMTALHWAVNFKEVKIVKILLRCKHIDVNLAQTKDAGKNAGRAPLHTACKIGSLPLVKILFDAGAKITATLSFGYKKGRTPLFSAVLGGDYDVIDFLLSNGADVNQRQPNDARKNSGQTALHLACRYKNSEIVDLLVDSGANVDIAQTKQASCNAGMTPLHWAVSRGSAETINYLVNDCKVNVNAIQGAGKAPLHFAVLNDDIETVRALLECEKIKVSLGQLECAGENAGYTPLHYACEKGFVKIITHLLLHKASINAKLNKRDSIYSEATPLTVAILSADLNNKQKAIIVTLLLKSGARVSQLYLCNIIEKKQNRLLEKFINTVIDSNDLKNLKTFASLCGNVGAQNIIRSKQEQIRKANSSHYSKNNKKKRKKKKKRKGGKGSGQNKGQHLNRTSSIEVEKNEEDELVELFDELCIDENGKISVHFSQKEEIKVLEDSDVQHKFVFSGLEAFGGKVLTITVYKSKKPIKWLNEISQYGFDLSQRVCTGTRRKLKAPKMTQAVGAWNVDAKTLQNPKMNNPNDPTHAFPRYVEKNCCQWAVQCDKESVVRYDKRDLPKGKKLSDYKEKLVIYIPGTIEYDNDESKTITIAGYFEYVILVPEGVVSEKNRPLCVHRFFRPYKSS